MSKTSIPWTEFTWNPCTGCDPVSPACKHCYAKKQAAWLQRMKQPRYRDGFKVRFHPDALDEPRKRRKATTWFVCSMGDLFHRDLTNEQIASVYGVMASTLGHTYKVLTKRADRLPEWYAWASDNLCSFVQIVEEDPGKLRFQGSCAPWPLRNVHVGVTVECLSELRRIEHLRRTPAAVRFLSVEPMLEPLCPNLDGIDQVIIGCESGNHRRPTELAWVRELVKHCRQADCPVFVKQLDIGGCIYEDPSNFPEDLRIREQPRTRND